MENTKKIGFIIHGLNIGGAEKFMISLINYFQNNNYQIVLFLLSDTKLLLHEINQDVKIHIVSRKFKYDIFTAFRIKKLILDESLQKIVCINVYSFFFAKLGFLWNDRVQFILSVHTTVPKTIKQYIQHFIFCTLIESNDIIIYLCKNQKEYFKKNYYIKSSNEFIINNGINTDYFSPVHFKPIDRYIYRSVYGIKHNEKIILKVARISPEKGHEDAIESLTVLHDKYKEYAHLFFIGDGDEKYVNSLKKLVKKRKLDSYVHFEGKNYDVRKFYIMSDVFTLTSISTETFSLAALEAMAFGLPCSLTEIGGASEMHVHNLTGILTRPSDPFDIATSWYLLLNKSPQKESIRKYVTDHFNISSMLYRYKKTIAPSQYEFA